jgi:HKD family nuclease
LKKAYERSARVKLLLGPQELEQCIEVKFYNKEQQHAKMIIMDEIAVIERSFNLTKSALTTNIENAQVVIDPKNVRKRVEEFNKLWSEAITIRKPEGLKPSQQAE